MKPFDIYTIFLLLIVLEAWSRISQYNFLKSTYNVAPVLMSQEVFDVARSYALNKQSLELFRIILTVFATAFWLFRGFEMLANIIPLNTLFNQTLFVLGFIVINYLIFLPIDLYSQFVLDKEYGFSNMTPKLFLQDFFKMAAIFLVLAVPIIYGILWIIETLAFWWLWCFAFLFTLVVLANWLFPVLFLPLFNKFEPINDAELEADIKALAAKSDFKISGVFRVDASKRDKRLNAYFAGFGSSKRAALFDTLLQKLSKDEILAVLAHEFGHYKHRDLIKGLALSAVVLFALCLIFGNLRIDGLGDSAAIIASQFLLFGGAVSFALSPLTNLLSRKNEFAADAYAASMGYKIFLADALKKLVEENRSFPLSSGVYKLFHHTHPAPIERLERLGH